MNEKIAYLVRSGGAALEVAKGACMCGATAAAAAAAAAGAEVLGGSEFGLGGGAPSDTGLKMTQVLIRGIQYTCSL